MSEAVKWLSDGTAVIVLGAGPARQSDDGRGNITEIATTKIARIDASQIEDVESEQVFDNEPERDPATGHPLSPEQQTEAVGDTTPEPKTAEELDAEISRLQALREQAGS